MKSRFRQCLNLDFVFYSKAILTDKNNLSQKSYQQVIYRFSLFSSDSFKGLGHALFFMYICPFFSFFFSLMIGAFFIQSIQGR